LQSGWPRSSRLDTVLLKAPAQLRISHPQAPDLLPKTPFWRQRNMTEITHVTDDTFESEVLQSDVPVLVDYWAEWCGPCKVIAPVLEEIATDYEGKMKICKLDIDANEETPPKYGIRGIPTLMLFKNGAVEATKVGALSKSQLTAFLDSNI
jgi:thioredoxin 1